MPISSSVNSSAIRTRTYGTPSGATSGGKIWSHAAVAVVIVLQAASVMPSAGQVRQGAETSDVRFEVSVNKYIMGTSVEATVMYTDVLAAQRALVDAFMEMQRIEAVMSVSKPESEVALLNREAAERPVKVSGEVLGILARSIDYCHRSDGLFDITVGPLSELWGFSGDEPVTVPDSSAVQELQSLTGCDRVHIDWADSTVSFSDAGVEVDLGGIAKGYAVDRAAAVLRSRGIDDFIVNAGGDLYASGEKEPGVPWRIGIKHPRNADSIVARLDARNEAVVTSGDYERFVIVDGRRYHHILDPRTGFSADGSRSVTVIAKSAEEADALATMIFVRGNAQEPDESGVSFLRVRADGSLQTGSIAEANHLEILDE